MTTLQLIDHTIPQLQLNDTLPKALQLMNDFKVTHLPVIQDERYLGLISESDILDKSELSDTLEIYKEDLIPASLGVTTHFTKAAPVCHLYQTNIILVIGETGDYIGSIRSLELLNAMGNFCGSNEFGAMIVLEIENAHLSISELNSIVESDGATILHLNISALPPSQILQVTLQINKREIATIIASFERYDYSISYYSGEELFENEINTNYQNLMNYLDI